MRPRSDPDQPRLKLNYSGIKHDGTKFRAAPSCSEAATLSPVIVSSSNEERADLLRKEKGALVPETFNPLFILYYIAATARPT
jgi:hypothetical protein